VLLDASRRLARFWLPLVVAACLLTVLRIVLYWRNPNETRRACLHEAHPRLPSQLPPPLMANSDSASRRPGFSTARRRIAMADSKGRRGSAVLPPSRPGLISRRWRVLTRPDTPDSPVIAPTGIYRRVE